MNNSVCSDYRARTRPGMVREGILEDRVFWEPGPAGFWPCLRSLLLQWSLSARNSHPILMIFCAHRLHPINSFERRVEGLFQLLSTLAALAVATNAVRVYGYVQDYCHGAPRHPGNSSAVPAHDAMSAECQSVHRLEGLFIFRFLQEHNYALLAVTFISSTMVSILTASLSVCFSVMRRPCLRPWLDWPLKGKNGAPSNMSPALHSRSCGECRGQQGMWQSILACLTFNLLSICLRTMVGLLLVLVGAAFLVARLLSSGSSSSKPIADMESDAQHVALGYLQAITLNWFVMSLVPYAATWLFSWARKSEPFPFPFETVMASNSQPFPEEELAILLSRDVQAFVLHNVLSKPECEAIIAAAEQSGRFEAALVNLGSAGMVKDAGLRNNSRCMIDDEAFAGEIFKRVRPFLPASCEVLTDRVPVPSQARYDPQAAAEAGTDPAVIDFARAEKGTLYLEGINERMRILRYSGSEEYFKPHRDRTYVRRGAHPTKAHDLSLLTLHVYLNESYVGGATRLIEEGFGEPDDAWKRAKLSSCDVPARQGSVLVFSHDIMHQGAPLAPQKEAEEVWEAARLSGLLGGGEVDQAAVVASEKALGLCPGDLAAAADRLSEATPPVQVKYSMRSDIMFTMVPARAASLSPPSSTSS